MKINILEIPSPTANNQYYYSLEKSLYGGYVVYIELKSDLKAYIMDKITIENIKKTDILDYEGVMKLIKLNQDGKVDASYTIMQILSLIIWNDIRDDNL